MDVLKTICEADKSDLENKILDTSGLVKKTYYRKVKYLVLLVWLQLLH